MRQDGCHYLALPRVVLPPYLPASHVFSVVFALFKLENLFSVSVDFHILQVADNHYRPDLKKAALARLSVVHRSLKVAKSGVKKRNRQATRISGRKWVRGLTCVFVFLEWLANAISFLIFECLLFKFLFVWFEDICLDCELKRLFFYGLIC